MASTVGGEGDPVAQKASDKKEPQGHFIRYLKSWDLVAFAGVITFVTTLAYEYGRAKYWKISADLIRFTPEHAVAVFAYIVVGGALVLQCLNAFLNSKFGRWYVVVAAPVLMLVAGYKVFQLWGGDGLTLLVCGLGYMALVYLVCGSSVELEPFGRRMVAAFGKPALALSAILLGMAFLGVGVGYGAAAQKTEFLVTESDPPSVILMTYGSDAICSKFTDQGGVGELSPSVQVISLTDSALGPLRTRTLKALRPKR